MNQKTDVLNYLKGNHRGEEQGCFQQRTGAAFFFRRQICKKDHQCTAAGRPSNLQQSEGLLLCGIAAGDQ